MNRKKRKCRMGGAAKRVSKDWFNKSRIWLPRNKSLKGGKLVGASYWLGKYKDWTKPKRGGNLLRRVYKNLRRGKGYTRADLTGITVDGRQLC